MNSVTFTWRDTTRGQDRFEVDDNAVGDIISQFNDPNCTIMSWTTTSHKWNTSGGYYMTTTMRQFICRDEVMGIAVLTRAQKVDHPS